MKQIEELRMSDEVIIMGGKNQKIILVWGALYIKEWWLNSHEDSSQEEQGDKGGINQRILRDLKNPR